MAAHAEGRHSTTTTTTTTNLSSLSSTSSSSSSSSSSYLSNTFGDNVASQIPSPSSSYSSSYSSSSLRYPPHFDTIKLLFVGCCFTYVVFCILAVCYLLKKRRIDQQIAKRRQAQWEGTRSRARQLQQHQQQQVQERRTKEQSPHLYCTLRPILSNEGPKRKHWEALVQWDPHLFPPHHGYNILKDRQGVQRFVKSANLLPSNKPRQTPPKIRFASEVGVKFIPRKDDPINSDAWNRDFSRMVAYNNQWQQQQWREEAEAKRQHRRLVVSAIAMREFRQSVLPSLVDQANSLLWRRAFRQTVVPGLLDHAHRLRWIWALQRRHAKAKFQDAILGSLPIHCHNLRKKWSFKSRFRETVVPRLSDHAHKLRWTWALERHHAKAKFQDAVMGSLPTHYQNLRKNWAFKATFRDTIVPRLVDHSHKLRWTWALECHHAKAKFKEAVLGSLPIHSQNVRKKWEFKNFFRRSHRSHVDESDSTTNNNGGETDSNNIDGAEINNNNVDPSDNEATELVHNDDDIDADADLDYDDDDDDDHAPAPTPTPPTTKPGQRRAGNAPEATTDGATVWVDGLRRSARLRPTLGSIYENGRRRSARFL